MIYLKDFQEKEKSKTIGDLEYRNDKKTLELSVVNLEKDTLVFTLPKLVFSFIKEGSVSAVKENNITVKPYVNYVFINKTVSYIQRDSSEKKSLALILRCREMRLDVLLGLDTKINL